MSLFNDNKQILEGKDFITQVADFITKSTKTKPEWAECVATSMLSTVMGPHRYISDVMGKLKLNVWYMCLGPSGLAKKTIPLNNYLFPIIGKVGPGEKLILSNRFSMEGFIKYFPEDGTGSIIRDEFTGLLKESKSKDYVVDLLEFLSELYDGTVQKRATVTHKINEIKHCYITFITATTPYLYKIMRPEFYTQGTGNRILMELFDVDAVDDDEYDPEEVFQGRVFDKKRDDFVYEIAIILNEIRSCNAKIFTPEDEAGAEWTKFEHECRRISKTYCKKNMYDLHYSYLSRSAEMALKLSGIYSISRNWDRILMSDAPNVQIIEKVDMVRAINKSKHHYKQFCRMLEQWRSRPEMRVASTLDEQADAVYELLRQSQNGLNWSELRNSLKWDDYVWRAVLKFLHDTNKMKVTFGSSGQKGGRRPTLFYDNSDSISVDGDVVRDWTVIQQKLRL